MQTLIVSVTYEKFLPIDFDAGEASDTGFLVKDEEVSFEDIAHFAGRYGFNAASSSEVDRNTWLSSTDADQDREYFEQGIENFYSLHIQQVDGKQPSAEQIRTIANVIFAKAAAPISLQQYN